MITRFRYKGVEYPFVKKAEDGYEELLVLIPETTGDYFLAEITSFGKYTMIEEVWSGNVEVIVTWDSPPKKQQPSKGW